MERRSYIYSAAFHATIVAVAVFGLPYYEPERIPEPPVILAELAPDRATEILSRARSFGESRLICGVHNLSAVEAGRTNGSIVVAGLHGSAAFRADMDAARKEMAALRKSARAPGGATCAAEAELIAKSPYN